MEVFAVRIPPSARSSTCAANGHDLGVGEACIVDTERGLEFGVVTRARLDNPFIDAGMSIPVVVRKAGLDEEEQFAHKASVESDARAFCLDRIREQRLDMKLGTVEMSLDGKRLTFFFTAEGRVDFRALVRDLSQRFRAKIDLRQIGARDDALAQGGCGHCGQTLCCSTWLPGFSPVSIRMAKDQGLSLNPSKISGMCGRLMCCLKYEYEGKLKTAPKGPRGDDRPSGERPGGKRTRGGRRSRSRNRKKKAPPSE